MIYIYILDEDMQEYARETTLKIPLNYPSDKGKIIAKLLFPNVNAAHATTINSLL